MPSKLNAKAKLSEFPDKDTVPYLVITASRLITANYMNRIGSIVSTPAQTYVLRELMVRGPLSQTDLAACLGVGKASLGETVTRLERDGFVKRARSKEDRRETLISLTSKTYAIEKRLIEASFGELDLIEDILGAFDYDAMKKLLNRLIDGLAEATDSDTVSLTETTRRKT